MIFFSRLRTFPLQLVVLGAVGCIPASAVAQATPVPDQHASLETPSLPDSPGFTLSSSAPSGANADSSSTGSPSSEPYPAAGFGQSLSLHPRLVASHTEKFIVPGQQAPRLTQGDKVRLGVKNAFSPFASFGWLTAASYSQAINSSPHYGQGWTPFAQRFGAAAVRGSSEGIFSDSVFAPLYHEDPRYYILGKGHSPLKRTLYAITRTVVTRSDDGKTTPNFSLLSGNAAGAILTNAYYPSSDRYATQTVETFAGSIGGSAIGFFLREFLSDALGAAHLHK